MTNAGCHRDPTRCRLSIWLFRKAIPKTTFPFNRTFPVRAEQELTTAVYGDGRILRTWFHSCKCSLRKGDDGCIVYGAWQLVREVRLEPADKFLLVESILSTACRKKSKAIGRRTQCQFTNVSWVFTIGVMEFQWKAQAA